MKYYCIDCGKEKKTGTPRCASCANKGKNNPMYGKKRDLNGSNNPMFGNAKYTETEAIVNDQIINWYKWKVFRKEILERDNYTCTTCGKKGNIIHHIKERAEFPELCWVKDNVTTVCKQCHINIDGHRNPKGSNQYVKR